MTKTNGFFSVKELYQLLSSQSTLPVHFTLLQQSYQRQNICYLYEHILALEQILQSKNQLPLTKYNALYTIQQMILTTKYAALTLVELYLLPILTDISSYLAYKRKEEHLQAYFLEKGYRDSVGVRKIGQKYVKLSAELIFLLAALKPYKNIMHKQVQIPSRFQLAASKLKQKVDFYVQNYSGQQVTVLREKYTKQLQRTHPHLFAQFVTTKIKQQIIFKPTINSSFKKIVQSEDAFLTIPIINLCVSSLSNITSHFSQKKVFLCLLNSFIRQGDIYAVVVVHNAIFVQQIFRSILKVPGHQSLSAGTLIYPQIDASNQDKLDFYCQFLKCLMIWAVCLPTNEIGQISEVSKLYKFLKEQKRFIFPEIVLLHKMQADFNNKLLEKEVHNDEILRIIDSDQKLLSQCAKWKESVVELSNKIDSLAQKSNNTSSNHSNTRIFQSLLREAMFRVEGLINEENISQNMKHLKSFQKEWPGLKLLYESKVNSDIIEEGDKIKKYVSDLYPLYLRLKKKSIPFQTFRRKVAALLGYKLSDFAQGPYDDYEVDPVSQNRQDESQSSISISKHSKSSNSINNLGCWSKVKSISNQQAKNRSSQLKKREYVQSEQIVDSKLECSNDYGIRQLLLKRKRYLNNLSSSKQVDKTIEQVDKTVKAYSEKILPSQINQSYSLESQQEPLFQSPKESNTKLNILESHKSQQQSSKLAGDNKKDSTEDHNKKVFQVYQIDIKRDNNNKDQCKKSNQSFNLRSRLHLQKIRYSSTRKAIESYAHKVSLSNSSNKNSFNSSRTTSRSIINHQYKKISFQRKQQSLTAQNQNGKPQSSINSRLEKNNIYTNEERPLNLQQYRSYFPQEKSKSFIRNCLKNKGKIIQNSNIAIRFVSFRKNTSLSFVLFFNAFKNITVSSLGIITDPNLQVNSKLNQSFALMKDEQKMIKLQMKVKATPYSLPQIKFLLSYDRTSETICFPLNATFNKFIKAQPSSIPKSLATTSKQQYISVKCEDIVVERSNNINHNIALFFQLQSLQRKQNLELRVQCCFQSWPFQVEIGRQSSKIKIVGLSRPQQILTLQFLLSSLCYMLSQD